MPRRPPENFRRCDARTRSGAPCRAPAMRHRERCRMHGGKTPRGIGSPHFKTGQYSRDFLARVMWRMGFTRAPARDRDEASA